MRRTDFGLATSRLRGAKLAVASLVLTALIQPLTSRASAKAVQEDAPPVLLTALSSQLLIPVEQSHLDIINNLVGRKCTIAASNPSASGGNVRGTGTWTCNRNYAAIAVAACVEVRNQGEWSDIGCNSNGKNSASSVSTTASGACLPGTHRYRTLAAGASSTEESDIRATGFIISGVTEITCS